jgi:hypothetical protein
MRKAEMRLLHVRKVFVTFTGLGNRIAAQSRPVMQLRLSCMKHEFGWLAGNLEMMVDYFMAGKEGICQGILVFLTGNRIRHNTEKM